MVGGTDISAQYQVLSITVARVLNRIPSATLHLKDGEASQQTFPASDTDLFVPGSEIEIHLGYRSQNDRVFKGIVISHGIKVRQNGSLLIVECKDVAVKMTQGTKSAFFVDQKDSEIIEEIIDSYGLTSDVESFDSEATSIVQYDSTDWDFMLCRAEAHGVFVSVIDGTVEVKKPNVSQDPAVNVAYGSTLLELDAEIDTRLQSEGITARTWAQADQARSETDAAEPSTPEAGNVSADDLAGIIGGGAHVLQLGGPIATPELQAIADARLMKERLSRIRGRATFQGFPSVVPGSVIELTSIGERFSGKHMVSGVRHSVSGGNWQTDVEFGIDPELFAKTFNVSALPASGLLPAVHGLQVGIVTAIEGDPDSEDRLQVRLPMVSDSEDGIWMRLATLDAGKNRGTFFRPEIDDEVIVGFINDDPRHGVILGQLHSSAHATPEPLTNDNHVKGYVSRSEMKLTFDDDKKIIHLETPGGNTISLTEEDSGIVIEDENGNTFTMSPDGFIVESVKDISIKASGDVKIEGTNIEFSASAGLKAAGSGQVELSGATTTVKGSGQTTISGGLVQIN